MFSRQRVEVMFILFSFFATTLSISPISYEGRNKPEPRKEMLINGPSPRFSETLSAREEHKKPAKEELKHEHLTNPDRELPLLPIDEAGASIMH